MGARRRRVQCRYVERGGACALFRGRTGQLSFFPSGMVGSARIAGEFGPRRVLIFLFSFLFSFPIHFLLHFHFLSLFILFLFFLISTTPHVAFFLPFLFSFCLPLSSPLFLLFMYIHFSSFLFFFSNHLVDIFIFPFLFCFLLFSFPRRDWRGGRRRPGRCVGKTATERWPCTLIFTVDARSNGREMQATWGWVQA